jgi:hypothetical protein
MKLLNSKTNSLKSKTLGLAMAAVLIPGGMAMATDGHAVRKNVSGHVEVVHQIPGGVVTVGADWGKRRNDPPPVVIVQQPQPQVIVVEQQRGVPHKRDREVTIIREQPRQQVTIIKTVPARREVVKKVVVIEKNGHGRNDNHHDDRRDNHGRNDHDRKGHDFSDGRIDKMHGGDNHYYTDGKQVSYTHNGKDGQYQYYKDANQVSETRVDGSGTYKYYEDANQVSIQDNRVGRERNVYVRK